MIPVIPPDHLFAVGGRITQATAAALAEARRIRDCWAEALVIAREEAQADARARAQTQVQALAQWTVTERHHLSTQALTLAQALASRIVGEAVHSDPDLLRRWLKELAPKDTPLTVHLHPRDAQAFGPSTPTVEVLADPGLAPGDLMLSSAHTRLDARVESLAARLIAGADTPP